MATTPVFLPRGSPWTEEPEGLQSMESQSDLAMHEYTVYVTINTKTTAYLVNGNIHM